MSQRSILSVLREWWQPLVVLAVLTTIIFSGIYVLNKRDENLIKEITNGRIAVTTEVFHLDISANQRGHFVTRFNTTEFRVAMLLGWELTCNKKKQQRAIESLFLAPNDKGVWSVYVENDAGCEQIKVGVAFLKGNYLKVTRQFPYKNWSAYKLKK